MQFFFLSAMGRSPWQEMFDLGFCRKNLWTFNQARHILSFLLQKQEYPRQELLAPLGHFFITAGLRKNLLTNGGWFTSWSFLCCFEYKLKNPFRILAYSAISNSSIRHRFKSKLPSVLVTGQSYLTTVCYYHTSVSNYYSVSWYHKLAVYKTRLAPVLVFGVE